MKKLDGITGEIIDAALKIHQGLGPGLLESVYESVLAKALEKRGFKVERQKPINFEFDGMEFSDGFRVDLLINDLVVVELKSVEKLAPIHGKQVLTYIRLMNLPIGLLINFGAATLKEGLKRIVNDLPASASPPVPSECECSARAQGGTPPREPEFDVNISLPRAPKGFPTFNSLTNYSPRPPRLRVSPKGFHTP